MGETRPVVLLGGAIAILAVFLSRFRPAWLLLTETAPPALVAAAIVLAMLAAGAGAIHVARALSPRSGEIPLLDAFIIGFPTFGTLIAIVAWIGVAMHATIAVVTFALAGVGLFILLRRRLCAPRIPLLLLIPILFAAVEAITPHSHHAHPAMSISTGAHATIAVTHTDRVNRRIAASAAK